MADNHLTIIESWKLSYANEVIVDLQHSLNGLMYGTLLKSNDTGLKWKVLYRMIFIQVQNQKRFEGERERFQRNQFQHPIGETFEKFEAKILEQERQGIYQYVLEPVKHTGKPLIGETLQIHSLQNSG
jgi:hypothetical protein